MTRAQQGSRAAALRSAVKAWRALPARARAVTYRRMQIGAQRQDVEAREARKSGRPLVARLHREDAAALRAAVKLLREAGRSK